MNVEELTEAVRELDRLQTLLQDLTGAYFEARSRLDPDWLIQAGGPNPGAGYYYRFKLGVTSFTPLDKTALLTITVTDLETGGLDAEYCRKVPFEDLLLDPEQGQERWRAESAARLAEEQAELERVRAATRKAALDRRIKMVQESLAALQAEAEEA